MSNLITGNQVLDLLSDLPVIQRVPKGTVFSAVISNMIGERGLVDRNNNIYTKVVLVLDIAGWNDTVDFHISFDQEAKLRTEFLKLAIDSELQVIVDGYRKDRNDREWPQWSIVIPEDRLAEYDSFRKERLKKDKPQAKAS